jgi:hypothetical protein
MGIAAVLAGHIDLSSRRAYFRIGRLASSERTSMRRPPRVKGQFGSCNQNRATADHREAQSSDMFLAITEPPRFHPHSSLELLAPVPAGVLNFQRVLPSRNRTEDLFRRSTFRPTYAVTRTRRCAIRIRKSLSGCGFFPPHLKGCISQWLVNFGGYPQPMQQDPKLPRHRYCCPLLPSFAALCRQS